MTFYVQKSYLKVVVRSTLFLLGLTLAGCGNIDVSKKRLQASDVRPTAELIPAFNGATLISDFVAVGPPKALARIRSNASGITWDPYLEQYFVVQNNAATIFRYDRKFNYLGQLEKRGNINNDTEGLSAIDGSGLLLVTEANIAYKISFNPAKSGKGGYSAVSSYQLEPPPLRRNKGYEAIAYRAKDVNRPARIYAGREGTARYKNATMRVVYFGERKPSFFNSPSFSYRDSSFSVSEPFNAEIKFAGVISDIAGMTFDPTGSSLIIVSQESSKAIQVDPDSGEIISQLPLAGAPTYEGITVGPNGELVLVSEKNLVQIYRKKNDENSAERKEQ